MGAPMNSEGPCRLRVELSSTAGTILALMLLLAPVPGLAIDPDKRFDDYVKDTWSIEEGLPQITALAIEQDDKGYLWIGTQAGIARFDGVSFDSYSPDNTPALPGLFTQDLFLDSKHRLWIATYKGVAWQKDGEFVSVPYRGLSGDEVAIDARSIIELPDGRIIVGASDGLFELHEGELIEIWPGRDTSAFSLLLHEGKLLVGSTGKVMSIAPGGSISDAPLPDREALVNHLAYANGRLWAGSSRGLFYNNEATGNWQRYDQHTNLAEQPIDAVFEDSDRNLWIATQQGLARLRDNVVVEFIPDNEPVAHRNIRTIFEDRERNLWLGSQWQGIARLWNGWTRRLDAQDGLQDPVVWSVARGREGELWVGSNEGLSRYSNGRFAVVIPGDELPHPNAYTLLDDGKRLWVGTRTGLVWYRDGRSWMPEIFSPMATVQVSGVVRDSAGNYWIASYNGLYRYREETSELKHFGRAEGMNENRIRVVYETREGQLLVGTHGGLHEVLDERVRRIGKDVGLPENLDVTSITQLSDGSLVIGTLSESLFHYDGGHWHEFTHRDGLPVNSPFFLAEDENGYLWVAGIRGLFRVPIDDFRNYTLGRIDKLRGEMILSERGDVRGAQKAYCCNGAGNAKGFLEDGTLWLPTRGGVVAVDTDGIVKNKVPPRLHVERVHYQGTSLRTTDGVMQLPASARDIAIEFTALSFQQPRSVVLRYRLRGYNDTWQMLEDGARRSATYTNLPAGDYVFEVAGTNNANVWASDNAEFAFRIAPHYWETMWFRLLLLAGLLLLIYFGYRFQLRNLTAQRARLEKTVRRRTEELRLANNQLRDAVQTDSLTGLHNRRFIQKQLPGDLAFYERNVNEPQHTKNMLVFALVDIDHLRRINEDHGPHVGDAVLRQFGKLLGQYTRAGDYIVRWEGEKFLLVFRPMEAGVFEGIAERMRTAVQNHEFNVEGSGKLHITASLGFMEMPLDPLEREPLQWEDFIELAEHALYYVKRTGRNGWATLRPTETTRRETLLDEVRLHLQALVDNGDLRIASNHGRQAPS